jgi:hypothetical protein
LRIAATLVGAALLALLMLPTTARAGTGSTEPPRADEQVFGERETALVTGAPELSLQDDDGAESGMKKRKKPQFQTRFFSE